MRSRWIYHYLALVALILSIHSIAVGAAKVHVIAFWKWKSVQGFSTNNANHTPIAMKVRSLIVDGRLKDYTMGAPREVTDRLFGVRRIFRVNDCLPEDSACALSVAARGMAACRSTHGVGFHRSTCPSSMAFVRLRVGIGTMLRIAEWPMMEKDAIVAQLSQRKPVLEKPISEEVSDDADADSACVAPEWRPNPLRVSSEAGGNKQTFAVRGHVADLASDGEEDSQ